MMAKIHENTMNTLLLRPLQDSDESSFRSAVREFEEEDPSWQFAFEYDPSVDFPDYVAKVNDWPKGLNLPTGWVPNSFLVGVVNGKIIGRLSLRHQLNDFLRSHGGHIGYGVVPSERKRGYASEMLRQALPLCVGLGIEQVLMTCEIDNIASRKGIEKNGGVYNSSIDLAERDIQAHYFWINTTV
jgi:predicted acetyltransferase